MIQFGLERRRVVTVQVGEERRKVRLERRGVETVQVEEEKRGGNSGWRAGDETVQVGELER